MGFETYFDLYKYLVQQGHDKEKNINIQYEKNKAPYIESQSANLIKEKVQHRFSMVELKALAFDDVYEKLPDVGRVKAFRAAYLTSGDPGQIVNKILNTIPTR